MISKGLMRKTGYFEIPVKDASYIESNYPFKYWLKMHMAELEKDFDPEDGLLKGFGICTYFDEMPDNVDPHTYRITVCDDMLQFENLNTGKIQQFGFEERCLEVPA